MAIFKTHKSESTYHAVQGSDEEHDQAPVARVNYKQPRYLLLPCLVLFLSVGWAVTAVSFWKSMKSSDGPLHVYTFTPIPKDVFEPVKKVFQPDDRYIGNSMEVDHHWDALVAGTYPGENREQNLQ